MKVSRVLELFQVLFLIGILIAFATRNVPQMASLAIVLDGARELLIALIFGVLLASACCYSESVNNLVQVRLASVAVTFMSFMLTSLETLNPPIIPVCLCAYTVTVSIGLVLKDR